MGDGSRIAEIRRRRIETHRRRAFPIEIGSVTRRTKRRIEAFPHHDIFRRRRIRVGQPDKLAGRRGMNGSIFRRRHIAGGQPGVRLPTHQQGKQHEHQNTCGPGNTRLSRAGEESPDRPHEFIEASSAHGVENHRGGKGQRQVQEYQTGRERCRKQREYEFEKHIHSHQQDSRFRKRTFHSLPFWLRCSIDGREATSISVPLPIFITSSILTLMGSPLIFWRKEMTE